MNEARIEFLRGVLAVDPDGVDALVELGWLLVSDAHEKDEGIALLQAALDKAPNSCEARYWLAKVYYHYDLSHLSDAKEFLARALTDEPSHPAIASLFGSICCETDEPQLALTHLRRALDREPSWVSLHSSLDRVLTQLNRLPEAIDAAKEAYRLALHFVTISTPDNYSYFEQCVTHRWTKQDDMAQLQTRASRRA